LVRLIVALHGAGGWLTGTINIVVHHGVASYLKAATSDSCREHATDSMGHNCYFVGTRSAVELDALVPVKGCGHLWPYTERLR